MRHYSIALDYSQGISKNGRKHYFTDRVVGTFNKRIQSGVVFGEYGPPTRETSEHPSSFLKRIHHVVTENIALKVVLFELDKYDRTKCIVTVRPCGAL